MGTHLYGSPCIFFDEEGAVKFSSWKTVGTSFGQEFVTC